MSVGTDKQDTGRAPRRYRSPRRGLQAAETRSAVLEAAAALFSERGWAGTGMREIAATAGVSVETVYASFGSKPDLLQAAFDVAVVGDGHPIAVANRPEFQALGSGTWADRARAAARMMTAVHASTGGLQRALREAAASDPDLAELLHKNEERRRSDVQTGAQLVIGHRVTATTRDGLWAVLSFEVYDLLVNRSGWSRRRYESWLAEAVACLTHENDAAPEEGE
jgi:AcrR family transcriptional regulator